MNGATLQPGVAIDGRYALERELGGGAFGTVWRALDQRTGRAVAVKFLRPELAGRGDIVERFAGEARVLAAMNHPNVVSVIDQGEWGEHRFLVMEHVEGETLSGWLATERRRHRLPAAPDVWLAVDQICRGVAAAHFKGIVHRDLKPDNVILNYQASGEVIAKVADFGIAQLGGRHQTATGWLVGTREYMAPEQGLGQVSKLGTASDVFALGVMLLEALTGRLHPDAQGEETWWSAAVRGQAAGVVAAFAGARPDVPPAVWTVVARALAEDPGTRPPHAEALRRELEVAWGPALRSSHASLAPTANPAAGAPPSPRMESVLAVPSMAGPGVAAQRGAVGANGLTRAAGRVSPVMIAAGAVVLAALLVAAGLALRGGGDVSPRAALPASATGSSVAVPAPIATPAAPASVPMPQPQPLPPSPPIAAPRPAQGARCVVQMDPQWAFHLRATDTPSRVGARNLPGGLSVEVLRPGDSWRDHRVSRTYLVRVVNGEAAGSMGYVFIHPADLVGRPECPQ